MVGRLPGHPGGRKQDTPVDHGIFEAECLLIPLATGNKGIPIYLLEEGRVCRQAGLELPDVGSVLLVRCTDSGNRMSIARQDLSMMQGSSGDLPSSFPSVDVALASDLSHARGLNQLQCNEQFCVLNADFELVAQVLHRGLQLQLVLLIVAVIYGASEQSDSKRLRILISYLLMSRRGHRV